MSKTCKINNNLKKLKKVLTLKLLFDIMNNVVRVKTALAQQV
jgi:hypothetical protein